MLKGTARMSIKETEYWNNIDGENAANIDQESPQLQFAKWFTDSYLRTRDKMIII